MADLNKITSGRIEIVGNDYPTWHGKGFQSPLCANVNKLFQVINWWTCRKHSDRAWLIQNQIEPQASMSQGCDCGCWKGADNDKK